MSIPPSTTVHLFGFDYPGRSRGTTVRRTRFRSRSRTTNRSGSRSALRVTSVAERVRRRRPRRVGSGNYQTYWRYRGGVSPSGRVRAAGSPVEVVRSVGSHAGRTPPAVPGPLERSHGPAGGAGDFGRQRGTGRPVTPRRTSARRVRTRGRAPTHRSTTAVTKRSPRAVICVNSTPYTQRTFRAVPVELGLGATSDASMTGLPGSHRKQTVARTVVLRSYRISYTLV